MSAPPPWVDAGRLPMAAAVDALERALLDGLDPAADDPRGRVELGDAGHLLTMPSLHGRFGGVKLSTVAPRNPARGLPRIQGIYALWDAETLAPVALLDAAAITSLRTPALSALAARHLSRGRARTLVVFGSGPQAAGHVDALRVVLPELERVHVVARNRGRAQAPGLTKPTTIRRLPPGNRTSRTRRSGCCKDLACRPGVRDRYRGRWRAVGHGAVHEADVVELHLVVVREHEQRWGRDPGEVRRCERGLLAVHAVELGQEDVEVLATVGRDFCVPVEELHHVWGQVEHPGEPAVVVKDAGGEHEPPDEVGTRQRNEQAEGRPVAVAEEVRRSADELFYECDRRGPSARS